MKKLLILTLVTTMVIAMLAGCVQAPVTPSQSVVASTAPSKPAETPSAAQPTPKKLSGTLTIYSSHESNILNQALPEFEKKTGVKTEQVPAGTSELFKKIEAETGNPLGDVMWGGGVESYNAYSKFFENYKTPEASKLNAAFVDPNGVWTGESPLPMIIMYNKNLVAESDVPKGWADLTNEKFKGKIAYADPAKSGSAYTILCTMLSAFGKDDGKGWDFIKSFYANLGGKLIGSSSAVYKGVADGEYSIGLTLEREAVNYINSGSPVGIIFPSEGTSAVPEGIAIIKGAKNMDNAKAFIDFVMSKECQTMMVQSFGRRPARSDVEPPKNNKPLSEIKLVNYDMAWAAGQKEAIMAKWKEIVVGQ